MNPSVQARCPVCDGTVDVPYILLGAPTACPACGKIVAPELPVGTVYPKTKYEITFRDFLLLVRGRAYRSTVDRLLDRWFGYHMRGEGDSAVVQTRNGEVIDLVGLHRQIQEDPAKQTEIYKAVMALWR